MDKDFLWITALGLLTTAAAAVIGLSFGNRRLQKAVRERKKFGRALSEANSRMASWMALFPGPVYRCTPDDDRAFLVVGDSIESVTGYPASDFTSRIRDYAHLIHPEDQAVTAFQMAQALKRGKCFEMKYRIQTADGKTRWILDKGMGSGKSGSEDPEQGIGWIDGIILDVTESKQDKEFLRMKEAMFRSLIDATPDLIVFKDRKGGYLDCNRAFADSIGKKRAEIIGKTDYDVLDREKADRSRETDLKMLSKMKPRKSREWFYSGDGRPKRLMETLKTPLFDADGKVIGLVSLSRDITPLKRLAAEIRRLRGSSS
jgi:PAS domain S-box-containing protein